MTIEPSGIAGSHAAYAGAHYSDSPYPTGHYPSAASSAYPATSYPAVPYQATSYSDTAYSDAGYSDSAYSDTGYSRSLPGSQPGGRYPAQPGGHADPGHAGDSYRDRVHVYEWQFYILDGEQAGFPWRENTNGLVALSSGIAVFTGTGNGQVPVSVQLYDAPPPVAYDAWDEIVEVSYYTARGDARICSWQREPAPGIPTVSRYGPGTYRVRAHAKGRDTSRDALRVLADEFCFAIWPAPGEATTIHKTTDEVGRVLRAGFSNSYHYR